MKEDAIIGVLKSRFKKLSKHFLKLQVSYGMDELHDYRLEMKKLKAFIRLLNIHQPHQEKIKLDQRLKNYYELTGNLRNLQLHEQRIQALASEHNLTLPIVFLTLLEKEQEKVVEQLRIAEQEISFENNCKEILSTGHMELKDSERKNYLVNQCNALVAILVPVTMNDEGLHEVRKIVKDIGYNRDYLGSYMSLFLPTLLVKKESVDGLAEKLGVFHDLCISHSLLQLPAVIQMKGLDDGAVLQEVQSIIEHKKRQMKEEVWQQLATI